MNVCGGTRALTYIGLYGSRNASPQGGAYPALVDSAKWFLSDMLICIPTTGCVLVVPHPGQQCSVLSVMYEA